MKVLVVHSPARSGIVTGEDVAAAGQVAALREAGHEVHEYDPAPRGKAELGATMGRLLLAGRPTPGLAATVADVRPDVVHVHKWFPWVTGGDFRTLAAPSVATLHNFRPLCPVGTLHRDGRFCDDCVSGPPVGLVVHKCHRDSYATSLGVAGTRPRAAAKHPFLSALTRYVVPSRRAAEIFTALGHIDAARYAVIPSFVDTLGVERADGVDDSWLFVGQLEEIKGIDKLIEVLPPGQALTVVGTGSLQGALEATARARGLDVRFLGAQPPVRVRELMARSRGVLFASTFLETQGLVVGEAAAVGCPVIALAGTAAADQVTLGGFGVVVTSLAQLPEAMATVAADRATFADLGLRYWDEYLARATWLRRMEALYEDAAAAFR